MTDAYYPGCSLEGISSEYDDSIRSLFAALDIPIQELENWICCGTLAAPSMSKLLGLATPLYSVAQAQEGGYDRIIAPCSACLYHFKNATKLVNDDPALKRQVSEVLEIPLNGLPRAIHPIELLSDELYEEKIKAALDPARDLSDLKVVCYYGCHISRPAEVMEFDDPENPTSMDTLMKWAGVQSLEWAGKGDCCGAHFSLIRPDIVVSLSQKIFISALEAGADAIIVACPMCHANLDTRQEEIGEKLGRELNLPVLYFSQVLGYALGISGEKLGMKKHIVDPLPLMLEKCKARKEVFA